MSYYEKMWKHDGDFIEFAAGIFVLLLELETFHDSEEQYRRFCKARKKVADSGDQQDLYDLGDEYGMDPYRVGLEIKCLMDEMTPQKWDDFKFMSDLHRFL